MSTAHRQEARPRARRLPEPALWLLLLVFGASTIGALQFLGVPELPIPDRLLAALSVSLLATSLVWFFFLALGRGALWSLAMLVPYVNLIAIAWFSRRYWAEGARAPTLLLLSSSLVQIALMARWLIEPALPVLL